MSRPGFPSMAWSARRAGVSSLWHGPGREASEADDDDDLDDLG